MLIADPWFCNIVDFLITTLISLFKYQVLQPYYNISFVCESSVKQLA